MSHFLKLHEMHSCTNSSIPFHLLPYHSLWYCDLDPGRDPHTVTVMTPLARLDTSESLGPAGSLDWKFRVTFPGSTSTAWDRNVNEPPVIFCKLY